MENNNLNTYRILYLVKGILTLVFSLFFVAYAFFGLYFMDIFEESIDDDAPFNPGNFLAIIGTVGFVITVIFGILTIMASNNIKNRKGYTFIFVVAIINCLTGILGILLGVFSLIELSKPEVKELFEEKK